LREAKSIMLKTSNMVYKTLVVGVIVLFIGVGIQPAIADIVKKEPFKSLSKGNIFYVGGSGEGNYTRIQDAIDNASDGDTVFVFDELSPYYESVWINKRINLIGENRNTTIIDGKNFYWQCITLVSDGITVSGFTVQNSSDDDFDNYGIILGCNNTRIEDNVIKNNKIGIGCLLSGSNNSISNNEIINNRVGIELFETKGNKVFQNIINVY